METRFSIRLLYFSLCPSAATRVRISVTHFRPPLLARCDNALPAADFEALLVRPSLRVLDAAVAAPDPVCFFGALTCDNALPAAFLEWDPVEILVNVFDALLAAF